MQRWGQIKQLSHRRRYSTSSGTYSGRKIADLHNRSFFRPLSRDTRRFARAEPVRLFKEQERSAELNFCTGGPAAAVREELPTLSDGDWLFRGFMGLSESPVLHALPLSPRGKFYGEALEKFWKPVQTRQASGFKSSNLELFDLEG